MSFGAATSRLTASTSGSAFLSLFSVNLIASTAKVEDLSPTVLALVGQHLFDAKRYDEALNYFTHLSKAFPESYYAESGPIGIGNIAIAKKEYDKALQAFEESLAKPSGAMIKEATFGKAQALFGLKQYDEAKKLCEEVIGTKEWRGEEKAGALFLRGEIAAQEKDPGAAHAYFQRVYLSHTAYPEYAAEAYLKAAEMLRLKAQDDEANATLRELIKHPKLKDTPQAIKAAKLVN